MFWGSMPVQAAEPGKDMQDQIQVEIISPDRIESTPIYTGNIEITVKNMSDTVYENLNCFLSVVDEDRKQSFPMDEFGADSYQVKPVGTLNPGGIQVVSIPVRIMYVGNFHLIANIIDYETHQVYAADSLATTMISNTNLHKNLVIAVSVMMPVILTGATMVLARKRGKRKNNYFKW